MFVPESFFMFPKFFNVPFEKFFITKKFSLKILTKNEMMDIHILDGW